MQTVVVTDNLFGALDIEEAILRPLGVNFVAVQCKTPETLIPAVAEADVVVTQFAPIKPEVIAAMKKARAIVRYGIGVDNVALDAARERGIPVCNVPDYCIDEVADHTLAFILAATRQVLTNDRHIRDGKWGFAGPLDSMRTLRDQTVGVVGFGRIGREVCSRLAPFKSRRLVFDPVVPAEAIRAAGCEPTTLDVLLAESDIVTLHCPSTAQTKKILNADSLAKLKRGAIVVNLARGDLIDAPALLAALSSGQVSAAALDVFDVEPLPADSPFRSLPNVVVASHLASVSAKAVRYLRESVAKIAAAAIRGERLPNIVNGVDA